MEPNGIFLNKTFQKNSIIGRGLEEKQDFSRIGLGSSKKQSASQKKACAIMPMKIMEAHATAVSEVTRSSPSSSSYYATIGENGIKMNMTEERIEKGTGGNQGPEIHCHHHHQLRKSKNKRPLRMAPEDGHSADQQENRNNNEWNNNNYYSVASSSSSSASSNIYSSISPFVDDSGSARGLQKIKSKSGVQGAGGCYSNFSKISKSCEEEDRKKKNDGGETMEEDDDGESTEGFTTLPTNPTSHSLLTWKLPSFLCLPFTNNESNNSYRNLVNSSSKSAGILSLTSLVLVVMAVLLASVPAPVMSATPAGEPSPLVTDDIISNDVTSHDYPTTSSSILPVKLQTIQFTSPAEGTTPDDSSLFLSSAATGRTTGGSSGPSVTHQSVEGLKKEPSMNDFPNWKDEDTLTAHSGEVESSSDKVNIHLIHQDDDEDLLHKEYEFKSGYPELHNETREALQEEGSNHRPVVFVGGSGYVPPNAVRPRPGGLEDDRDPLWQDRPVVAETRYPVPLQSAWDRNYRNPFNMTRVQHIEAECQDDFMKIRVAFNGSFRGLIYSSGYSYDPDCVYVNGSGPDFYEYLIKLNRCGTLGASNHVEGRREPSKNFMWNTVTVQYNPMIEEEWDEHFKVTCEYGYDFWKTVTFPFLDVEVATGNPVVFTLTPPECYMEVRYGFGTAGTRVGGPVRVGDPLTLMINMRSQYDGFDIVVNDCYAHNGATKRIQLIDHYGCPVDSKLMSPFRGTWSHTNLYETQVYAYLKTFRFTGSPALYIECDVRMCHGQCPAQPCYWRNVKSISKRSTDSQQQIMVTDSEKNSTLSENLSLFQALRVLQEDEDSEALKTSLDTPESVCMKTGAFTAMIGMSTFILVILTVSTMIMCFRLRRVKVIEERETAADILRPYSHHVSQPSQQHNHHRQHHHWSSAKPR